MRFILQEMRSKTPGNPTKNDIEHLLSVDENIREGWDAIIADNVGSLAQSRGYTVKDVEGSLLRKRQKVPMASTYASLMADHRASRSRGGNVCQVQEQHRQNLQYGVENEPHRGDGRRQALAR